MVHNGDATPKLNEHLGKILVDAGMINQEQLETALHMQADTGLPLGKVLVENAFCSEEEVTSAYALQIGVRYVKLSDFEIEPHVIDRINPTLARKHLLFPVHLKQDTLLLAMADPLDRKVIDGIEFFLNCRVEPVIASEREIRDAINNYYKTVEPPEDEANDVEAEWEREAALREARGEEPGDDRNFAFSGVIGRSRVMIELYKNVLKVARSNATVLLLGESGTGKEVIAEAIHSTSPRRPHPFIKVSCAALPESLLESELFGHEKGAFTGAFKRRLGRFELANHGTLFLDEIGELSLNIQVKLLRVLQQRLITRLGGVESIPVDVRILAATNRDLKQAVACGDFRKDLYYRLNVISFVLPPMRHRKEDVPLLVEHFLKRFNEREGKHVSVIHPEVMRIFRLYDWPGNVREIENCIERAVVMADGIQVGIEHLPHNLRELNEEQGEGHIAGEPGEAPNLHEMEKQQICRMLRETNWNMNTTAARLGIHRNTLRRKLERYQIRKPGRK